jgi:hypothetical protein
LGFERNGKPGFVLNKRLPSDSYKVTTIYLALQLLARSCERPVRDPNEDIALLLLHQRGFATASCRHEQRNAADCCSPSPRLRGGSHIISLFTLSRARLDQYCLCGTFPGFALRRRQAKLDSKRKNVSRLIL